MPTMRKKPVPAGSAAPATPSPNKIARTAALSGKNAVASPSSSSPPSLPLAARGPNHRPQETQQQQKQHPRATTSASPPRPATGVPHRAASSSSPSSSAISVDRHSEMGTSLRIPPAPPSKPPTAKRRKAASATAAAADEDGGKLKKQASSAVGKLRKPSMPPPLPRAAAPVRSVAAGTGGVGGDGSRFNGRFGDDGRSRAAAASSSSSSYEPPRTADAIDEVINEVNHLLQSAAEAQSLGRLRNSYSCLLLAHQRMVGVGRRVDRTRCEAEDVSQPAVDPSSSPGRRRRQPGEEEEEEGSAAVPAAEGSAPTSPPPPGTTTTSTPLLLPPLVSQPPVPPNLAGDYSDVAYVEHLARSAMELHHKRTGRGMQHDAALERAAHVARMKRMEQEQIHRAARGVFALATGGAAGGGAGEETSPTKRKGGRGKKPPTLVMHTMAGRNLDVRELMRGVL